MLLLQTVAISQHKNKAMGCLLKGYLQLRATKIGKVGTEYVTFSALITTVK